MWTKEEYTQLVWECENKITQLENELASARRMKQFYIDEYAKQPQQTIKEQEIEDMS